jgi:chemotaxis protein methyltransferase CheR
MALTEFFGDAKTFEAICKLAIPELRTRRFIKIWDAGCATEQEPFSLAIHIRELVGHMYYRNIKIHATDIDVANLDEEAIYDLAYPRTQMSHISNDMFEKYFEPGEKDGTFAVTEEIKDTVTFEKHDLLTLKPLEQNFSLILCKNVLPAFKDDIRYNIIKMFYDSLVEQGFLVLGKTQKLPKDFTRLFDVVSQDENVFRKK